MTTRVLVQADESTTRWLAECLGQSTGYAIAETPEDLQREVEAARGPVLVFVQVDRAGENDFQAFFRRLASQNTGLSLIAVSSHTDPGQVLDYIRAGAADFLVPGQDDGRVPELVSAITQRPRSQPRQTSSIITLLGGHADSGIGFLGVHLALLLTQQCSHDESILLLDLAAPAATAALCLNMQSDYSALDAVDDAWRCDETLVDTAFPRHQDGLYVLSLPESLGEGALLNADALERFLEVAGGLFSRVIITADRSLGDTSLRCIVERSSKCLILTDQSILSVRHNQQLLSGMRGAGVDLSDTAVVVDRYNRRVGLEPDRLAELMRLPLAGVLAGDPVNRLKAMNAGESLFAGTGNDEYLRGLRRLAHEWLQSGITAVADKRGLLDRLFG